MTGWILVAGAIGSNIAANIALKQTLDLAGVQQGPIAYARFAVTSPSFWLFVVSAGLLAGFYILSVRIFDLPTIYATVTSLSLVGVTLASAWLFGDAITPLKIVGTTLIVAGIFLVTRA